MGTVQLPFTIATVRDSMPDTEIQKHIHLIYLTI